MKLANTFSRSIAKNRLPLVSTALAIALVTFAPVASAEESTAADELRGFYARIELGATVDRGVMHWKHASPGNCSGQGEVNIAGRGGGLRFAAGYAPISGLALAAELGEAVSTLSEGADSSNFMHVGLLAAWRPRPSSPLRFELGAAVAAASFGEEGTVAKSKCINGGCCGGVRLGELPNPVGPTAHLGVGYAFRVGSFELGPVLRFRGAWLDGGELSSNKSARVNLYAATLGFGATFW